LLSGSTVQRVTQGQSADPPEVTKDGASFRSWSASYRYVTHDIVIKAVWEYATTPGIEYSAPQEGRDRNYCEVIGSYQHLSGAVYIDGLYNEKTVIAIGNGAFKNRNMITSMYLLDGILDIGNEAFSNCTAMQAIEIPSTVLHLGERALENCKSLVSVNIADSCSKIVTISDKTFYACSALESVVLPKSLININGYAFYNCTSLGNITLPDGLLYIQENAFQNAFKEGTSLIIPESVEVINTYAFAGTSLKEVTINGLQSFKDNPSAVKNYNHLFQYSLKLEKVTLGENVDAILPYMFYCCYELKTLIIENQSNITYIGDGAFKGTNIQNYNLTLSANLQYLGANFAAQSDSPYNSAYVQPTFNITFADASALSVCRNLGTNRYEKVCTEITATYWAETGYNLVAKSYYYVASETYLNG